jgi:hypothetical protein
LGVDLSLSGEIYCSEKCRREAGGGGGSGVGAAAAGVGGAVLGAIGSAFATDKEAEELKKSQLNEERIALDNVVNLQFSDSKEGLLNQMEQLLILYSAKKGDTNSGEVEDSQKKTRKIILEKLEFGILKLKRIAPEDSGYIEKKFLSIKKKIKTILIVKLSLAGVGVLLTIIGFAAESLVGWLGIFMAIFSLLALFF